MFRVVTTIHDPVALAAACRELGLPAPAGGTLRLGNQAVAGQVVRLPGLLYPVACDTVTGLVAYHPADNAHAPFARLMRFVAAYYAVRGRLRYTPVRRRRHRGRTDVA